MRLLETFQDQSVAQDFLDLLGAHNIESNIEPRINPETKKAEFLIWVHSEDQIDQALAILEEFKKDPKAALNRKPKVEPSSDQSPLESDPQEQNPPIEKPIEGPIKVKVSPRMMNLRAAAPLTKWVIILCVVLFFWNGYQKISMSKEYPALMKYLSLTSLDKSLVYDVPLTFELLESFFKKYPEIDIDKLSEQPENIQEEFKKIQSTPYFLGLYQMMIDKATGKKIPKEMNLFRKIKQGQIWRTFTPCILHKGLLHILFNMLWLWLLGRQVEQKIGKARYLLFMIVVGIISNTFQYLLSGPYFLGYSGVISGLGGFIWVRQKTAPWEGYNIQKSVLMFLGIFILAMVALQIVSFILLVFQLGTFNITIANTAHVSGAICGMVLARIPFFYKVRS